MTADPVSLETLLETRERLAAEVHARLDDNLRRFLLSVQSAEPRWERLGVKGAEHLPAVRWRMLNLGKMSAESRNKELARLEKVLTR